MKRVRSQYPDPEPFALRVTMLLIKLGLGAMTLLAAGVALLNYCILLHSDGQVEFARKPEWTIADTFRFIPEEGASPSPAPPPPPPPVIASASSPPAPASSLQPPASPRIQIAAARVRPPPRPAPAPVADEEEAGD